MSELLTTESKRKVSRHILIRAVVAATALLGACDNENDSISLKTPASESRVVTANTITEVVEKNYITINQTDFTREIDNKNDGSGKLGVFNMDCEDPLYENNPSYTGYMSTGTIYSPGHYPDKGSFSIAGEVSSWNGSAGNAIEYSAAAAQVYQGDGVFTIQAMNGGEVQVIDVNDANQLPVVVSDEHVELKFEPLRVPEITIGEMSVKATITCVDDKVVNSL